MKIHEINYKFGSRFANSIKPAMMTDRHWQNGGTSIFHPVYSSNDVHTSLDRSPCG